MAKCLLVVRKREVTINDDMEVFYCKTGERIGIATGKKTGNGNPEVNAEYIPRAMKFRYSWSINDWDGYDWLNDNFCEQERRLVDICKSYANDPAGLPGHALMLIVARMANLLDKYEERED